MWPAVELVLAQITVGDVPAVLRADTLALVLGTAPRAMGLLTLGISTVVRRAAGPPWLGLFALLYSTTSSRWRRSTGRADSDVLREQALQRTLREAELPNELVDVQKCPGLAQRLDEPAVLDKRREVAGRVISLVP